ncbi:GMC family oxidoreductase [Microbacterium sp. SORGH_AS_0888]|uniref:GMC family oxidoreductase n=1 Tax=Microbacterium sp. SORGH_AS_0888 TaxID=3041791 RepID=UPI00277F1104|nr:GMC family oxidoreductase N-terminal domain-containing protein [Microbacterium sp. SORGH_AS_0888]MDQ1129676.1 choline dehydrogenase [Microbacterium sp. SORGH_AS_0888]
MNGRVVVVGAGGAGIPLAARLAGAGREVVLVEAGGRPADAAGRRAAFGPAWTVRAGIPGGAHVWEYDALLQEGRPWRVARGRAFGGSTAVNGAYFQRPHPTDFARWADAAGPEWSYDACLPALRRLERDLDLEETPVHGADGPVPVQRIGGDDPLTRGFLDAAVDLGAVREADKNGGGPSGAGLLPRNAVGAQRWDTGLAYAPLLGGVEVLADAEALRVIRRGDRAVGVELVQAGEIRTIGAEEVVLAAGAIETPRLLRASGVDRMVGEGLSDHAAVSIAWRPRAGVATTLRDAAWTAAWNPPAGGVAERGVEYLFAVRPGDSIVGGDPDAVGAIELRITLAEPDSRGRVSAREEAVAIRYGHLAAPADRRALRDAVRTGIRLLRSPALAWAVDADDAHGLETGEDAALDAWIGSRLGTALHASGTAAMGERGVTDAHGRVRGMRGLRVADTSLLPVVPTRGTALAAVMVGERIAELMLAE